MEELFRDFFSLFDEPLGAVKMGALALLLPVPFLDFLVLGYLGRLARTVLDTEEFLLPDAGDLQMTFSEGCRIALLIALLFLPSLIALIGAAIVLFAMIKSGGSGLLGHALVLSFFVLGAIFFGLLSLLAFPSALFRFAEGGEIGWAVSAGGIVEDLSQMGSGYWQIWLALLIVFFIVEFLLAAVAVPLGFFPAGRWLAAILFIFASSFAVVYLLILGIKRNAPLFKEVHYRY